MQTHAEKALRIYTASQRKFWGKKLRRWKF